MILSVKAEVNKGGDEQPELLLQQLGNLIGQAKSELLIVSPYFVPGKVGTRVVEWMLPGAESGYRC